MVSDQHILVTGGTGYIASCLIPRLLEKGCKVRVLVRNPQRLNGREWVSKVDVVQGDLLSDRSLDLALSGISTAYYLVHQMSSGPGYFEKEIQAAEKFASAADRHDLDHIIYLGGLADPEREIGKHLRSRIRTGETLRIGNVPVTEFRASLIIGSGSISFELIRYLTEQLPMLIGSGCADHFTQPVDIRDVLQYLLSALESPDCRGNTYEIGGEDVLTYADTILTYAHLRGLKRRLLLIRNLPIDWMARIAGKLTPIPYRVAGPLLGGMCTDSVVQNDAASKDFPHIQPKGYQSSVRLALERLSPDGIEIEWSDDHAPFRVNQEGFFIEGHSTILQCSPQVAFRVISEMGGKNGWLALNVLWKIRGTIDRLIGGPGMRGRPGGASLVQGGIVDFYRVELLKENHLVRLRAELKAPGVGWMEWRIRPETGGSVTLVQLAYFAPKGAYGFLYWYLLLPFHRLVFSKLLTAIERHTQISHLSGNVI